MWLPPPGRLCCFGSEPPSSRFIIVSDYQWMAATLIDFYINVFAISVWVAYKESSWISTTIWIVLLICFGSITTCGYITLQLFQVSYQDPIYHVLLNSHKYGIAT
ncbi:hypothetical protein U9M48_027184 [Paspalum notatum var. saurae]|uniref:Uncharacterized protein n=1 Tax=Paspalum notatum var. saurae TaxID=547442 RepID=A0AAQ3WZU4_PASNO